MKSGNMMIAVTSAVGGAAVALLVIVAPNVGSTTKSERLDGTSTETAFLPERFGVPSTNP